MQTKAQFFYIALAILIASLILHFAHDHSVHMASDYISERNNRWSYFASKSVKSRLYEIERNHITIELSDSKNNKTREQILNSIGRDIDNELSRYHAEKDNIQAEAIKYDHLYQVTKRKIDLYLFAELLTILSLFTIIMRGAGIITDNNSKIKLLSYAPVSIGIIIGLIALLI